MDLKSIIRNNYLINPITITKTEYGSGKSAIVETKEAKFLAKWNERDDFITIYERVQAHLNTVGIKQNRIIKTTDQALKTNEDVVLYEYCEGKQYRVLTQNQMNHVIQYLKKYNEQLKQVTFKPDDIQKTNHWDLAKSIDFMVGEFMNYLPQFNIQDQHKNKLLEALLIIKTKKHILDQAEKQLIHGDLGPDNILFSDDEVMAFIDFTPEFNHEFYSLCQFIYWNVLWFNLDVHNLETYIKLYDEEHNKELFYLLMIEAGLFRLIGPMMDTLNQHKYSVEHLDKRFYLLDQILNLYQNSKLEL